MVIFTDGLLEAEYRQGEPFGVGRLCRVMDAEHARRRIAGLKYAILDGLLDHTRNLPVEDDLTVLATEIR